MARFTSYSSKAKPTDSDTLLINDSGSSSNKQVSFTAVMSWVKDKLGSSTIDGLDTTSKNVVGAINELRSGVNGKADQSNTYTKTEVDALIDEVEVETDTTLEIAGAAADAKKTGDELTAIRADLDAIEPGLSDDAKTALLNCFAHVAWIDADGQSYYSALADELFPSADSINAVFSQGQNKIYDTDTLNDLKQYLTVTALYADGRTREVDDYTLSGVLVHGSSTITVTKDGKTATFTVQVDYLTYTWNYTDGSPIDNGMLVYASGGTAEMTANGYSIAATNASDVSYRLYYPWPNLDAEYTKVIVELDFILDGWGSYNNAPYMNGIRLSPGFGNRGGNTINSPAFVFNTSGVTSWHPTDGNQYNQAVLNAYSFTVGNEYTIKLDVDTQSTKIYVNDVLVAEETSTYYVDLARSTLFGVSRGASITIKSYKEQRGIS